MHKDKSIPLDKDFCRGQVVKTIMLIIIGGITEAPKMMYLYLCEYIYQIEN
jgi:hypothetical protein